MSACVQQTGGRVRRGAAYYRSISAARDSGTRSMSDVTHSGAVSKLLVTNAWSCARNQRRSIHTKPTGEEKKPPRIRTAVGRSGRTSVVVGAETRTRTRIRMRMRMRVSAREEGEGGRPGPAYGGSRPRTGRRAAPRCRTWRAAPCPRCLSRAQTNTRARASAVAALHPASRLGLTG